MPFAFRLKLDKNQPFFGDDVMEKTIPLNERIIFALDVDSAAEAEMWVRKLKSHVRFFKVGLQLFIADWWHGIDVVLQNDCKVMVDLKLFDIPETVSLAVDKLKNKGVTFITVHGNDPIVRAAVAAKSDAKLLAVTVLTSFDEGDMREMGLTGTIEDLVLMRAKRALALGCDGVVSSGLEAARLREHLGEKFLVVTPGIRPGKNIDELKNDDQKRILSAYQAIANGADHVVVGRPISKAIDPIAVVGAMQEEIEKALAIKAL
jgi:orotidine-5'-phosphate decarboxylase